ncbi:hypothetical protein E4V01_22600 [Methylorubrum sp. Q1]|uniref:hypothetical protein n=1 Tax=Methylorubrum sp. Q1 TaxID=2562453 RepID=UPI001075FDCE|nr:hypothetical protein [Methylorubrum sp. Q1]TFZ55365.1 hypothetical protein E4V01_22600 [Methylorubrum sp. Q1]
MRLADLPALVTQREEAVTLLDAIAAGIDERELAPFVSALTTAEDEQAVAIMRGSGNETSLRVQLGALLTEAGLVSEDEVFQAFDARRARARGAVA